MLWLVHCRHSVGRYVKSLLDSVTSIINRIYTLLISLADEYFNQLSSYLGVGALASGFIQSRPDDMFGLPVASAFNGDRFKQLNNGAVDDQEITIELTYSTLISENIRVQPDIQYIINPGTDPSLDNSWLVGLRFEVGFSN